MQALKTDIPRYKTGKKNTSCVYDRFKSNLSVVTDSQNQILCFVITIRFQKKIDIAITIEFIVGIGIVYIGNMISWFSKKLLRYMKDEMISNWKSQFI